jgi:hypothetical protein
MRMRGQRQVLAALPPGMTSCHYIGGWLGTRAGLNGCGKSLLPPGCDPPIARPVANPYTSYSFPASRIWCKCIKPPLINGNYLTRQMKARTRLERKMGTFLFLFTTVPSS